MTNAVRGTKASKAWAATAFAVLLLLLTLVFVFQNGDNVEVRFLFMNGEVALGLALLLAAVLGGLVVLMFGLVRVTQLRRATKRSS